MQCQFLDHSDRVPGDLRVSFAATCPAYIPNVLVPKIRNPDITSAEQLLVERLYTAKVPFQVSLSWSKLQAP